MSGYGFIDQVFPQWDKGNDGRKMTSNRNLRWRLEHISAE